MSNGYDIAKAYEKHELVGWREYLEPGSAARALANSPHILRSAPIFNEYAKYKGTRTMLYDVTRKVLGKDTPNFAQQIGDCVSFGAKNATEYTSCCDILIRREAEKFRPVFTPYFYGTGRVYVGGWDNDFSDGSLGSYMAQAVVKYGTLFSDEPGCPVYSGSVAKQFGAKRSLLDQWKPKAIDFPIQDAIVIRTWEEFVCALSNYYAIATASNVGFSMEAGRDGFFVQNTSWAHQESFIGVDDNDKDPYAIMLNSWGDVHGRLKDFITGEDMPIGILRIRRKDVEKIIKSGETYAYCNLKGAPGQRERIQKELFRVF